MEAHLPEAVSYDTDRVAEIILDLLDQLKEARSRAQWLEQEIDFHRTALRRRGVNPFPEQYEDDGVAKVGDLPVAERAAVAVAISSEPELTAREILTIMNDAATQAMLPLSLGGSNPLATLLTALKRTPYFERPPESSTHWRLTREGSAKALSVLSAIGLEQEQRLADQGKESP